LAFSCIQPIATAQTQLWQVFALVWSEPPQVRKRTAFGGLIGSRFNPGPAMVSIKGSKTASSAYPGLTLSMGKWTLISPPQHPQRPKRKAIEERISAAVAKTRTELREWISSGFTRVEDVAYVGLGLVLAVSALVMPVIVALSLGQAIISANLPQKIVRLLDQSLLILMIVEILYTLQVSFREHTLVAEPFLIVGLIAAIRRVLFLTAEFSRPAEIGEAAFHNVISELGLLTALILALVVSLFLLKRQHVASADHA
jgi:uncharacterized membrane protein (DUF373 family)